MNPIKSNVLLFALKFTVISVMLTGSALAVTPAQLPLNIGVSAAKPNIMLMLDSSGSMDTVVALTYDNETPANMKPDNYKFDCSNKANGGVKTGSPAPLIMIVSRTGTPQFCDNSTCTRVVNFGSKGRCFDNGLFYNVAYYNGATLASGPYKGINLNWYFRNKSFGPGSLTPLATSSKRIDIAKDAAVDLVNTLTPDAGELPRVRMGLARYNGDEGGMLISEIKYLDATHSSALKTQINNITPTDWTPLAETLADIGKYFTTGETGNLTLHPDSPTPSTASINSIFSKADGTTSRSINNATGNSTLASPILGYCQRSFAILISDGLPSQDRNISPKLRDYTGSCGTKNLCDATPNSLNLAGVTTPLTATGTSCDSWGNWGNKACQNGTKAGRAYEVSGGSDYLDDVAQALYEMDLRPSLDVAKKAETAEKNNLSTYTIGIADANLQQESVLKDAANIAGGKFYYAADAKELAIALDNTIADITSKISSSASAVANSAKLDTSSAIYQGKFDSADWSGSLLMYPLTPSEDTNGDGKLSASEDINGNGKLDGGSIGTLVWNAANNIPSFNTSDTIPDRKIYTYKYDTTSVPQVKAGISFTCANLSATQKSELGITDCANSNDVGVWRFNYILGDWSHEKRHPKYLDTDTIRPAKTATTLAIFRNRTHINKDTKIKEGSDPWLLGDIVNSNPAYVSDENYNYDKLPSTYSEASSYKSFVAGNATRRKMVYVGANDGMLHAFDASATGADAGKEMFAFIPNSIFDRLSAMTSPDYGHHYTVDGSPRVGDVYYGGSWHTVLVGTTGAGGKGIFALDITNPNSFAASNILWEISDNQSPRDADLTTDTTTLRGFASNLGYTLPQPSIVRLKSGWAAIVGNGYASDNNLAVLYIIDIETGHLIATLDTKVGSATSPNGLSTPIAVDADGDKIAETIYAGDLQGNLWKFDVNSDTPSQWKVAYGSAATPAPLFVACGNPSACDSTRQPITAKPQVGRAGTAQGSTGLMVYFGSGKYFEDIDNLVANAQTQTIYGVWDNNAVVAKSSLLQQTIVEELDSNIRVTSNTTVDYATYKGWYLDLLKPSSTASDGERVVSFPLLRGGRLILNSLVPLPPAATAICGEASEGTSWLYEIEALNGSRLEDTANGAPWDLTGDGMITEADLVTIDGSKFAASGKQSKIGIANTPAVVSNGRLEYKYTSGSREGRLDVITEQASTGGAAGNRQSWRQMPQ